MMWVQFEMIDWVIRWSEGLLMGVLLLVTDHLRSPNSEAAWLREVPGTFFDRQNSTSDRSLSLKHWRRFTTLWEKMYIVWLARE